MTAEGWEEPVLLARRGQCICRNGGRPVNGFLYVSPSCPVHYNVRVLPEADPEMGTDELSEWWSAQAKKRVHYPKMKVGQR